MTSTLRQPFVAFLATIVLVLTGATAAPAHDHRDDGSEPLPGYTISNPPLQPLTVDGEPTRVIQGVHEHAAYDVEVPPNWNGQLVLWAHGFRGQDNVLTVDPPAYGLRQTFADQGYAWAASSYYANGYDVRAGVLSTHDLARFAGKLLPKHPKRTYIAGVSMGGHVIGRSVEEYPNFYDGALPMCGVLGDVRLFDFFLDYNLVAQDLADRPAYPFPDDYQSDDVPAIQEALGLDRLRPGAPDTTNWLGKQLREVTINESGGARPGDEAAFAVWQDFLFTLGSADNGETLAQVPGRVAQNIGRTYRPSSPVDINASVQRVRPTDPASRHTKKLTAVPRIFGKPKVPVLTLHGLGDMFVPFSMEQIYQRRVANQRQGDLVVQRAIRAAGHCEFTPTEVGTAWNDLRTWVEAKGKKARAEARPAGDNVQDPSVVASATYGCRFTDPAGYASPAQFPTRGLYARCP